MDFDYSDYEDSETFEEQMEETPTLSLSDEDGLSHDISFKGHIDDIYDPEIKYAHDRLVDHTEDLLHAKNADEAQSALNHIKEDRNSADYWEDCKRSALVESEKNDIFLEGINAQLEIIEKYRK
jgi:hypothetical protein